jgi:hypothetical protein
MYTKIYWIHDFANGAKLGIMPRPRGDDWLEEEIVKLKKLKVGRERFELPVFLLYQIYSLV